MRNTYCYLLFNTSSMIIDNNKFTIILIYNIYEMERYNVALPKNYIVNIRVGNNPYEEEFEIKSTLYGIEAYIRTKYWDDVEVNSIRLIRELKLKIGFTED